jgi:hypothetical protein
MGINVGTGRSMLVTGGARGVEPSDAALAEATSAVGHDVQVFHSDHTRAVGQAVTWIPGGDDA